MSHYLTDNDTYDTFVNKYRQEMEIEKRTDEASHCFAGALSSPFAYCKTAQLTFLSCHIASVTSVTSEVI